MSNSPWRPASAASALGGALLVLLSGCFGSGGDPTSTGGTQIVAPTASFGTDTGAVDGLVTDEGFQPIAGATAVLGSLNLNATTALDGHFTFSFVAPGTYRLLVTADGFKPAERSLDVRAGDLAELVIRLEQAPVTGGAYAALLTPFEGLIGCSIGLPIVNVQQSDKCKKDGLVNGSGINNNAKDTFYPPFDVGVPITGISYELVWQGSSVAGGSLLTMVVIPPNQKVPYSVELSPGAKVTGPGVIKGKSPLRITYKANESVENPLFKFSKPDSSALITSVRAAGSTYQEFLASPTDDGSSKLVYEQKFTLYMTLFYNGADIPAGYTHTQP